MNAKSLSSLVRSRLVLTAVAVICLVFIGGLATPFVARAVPPAPGLVSPANFSTATVSNYPPQAVPVFRWQPVAGTTSYRIQIANNIQFNPVQYEATTPTTSYIPTSDGIFSDGNWYWRVRADSPSVGDYAFPWQVTRSWGNPSNAPTLLAPAPGATIEFFEDPIFSWTSVIGASSYRLKVSASSPDCSSNLSVDVTTLTTHYNLNNRLTNGTYYWCVIPQDANGRDGQSSSARSVTVAFAQSPQLLAPANGSTPIYTPQFSWTAVKGAYAYRLYVGTTQNFAPGTYNLRDVYQTTYTLDNSLPNDQTTYWKVTALYGPAEGPPSSTWQFQKHWYHQPIILTPRNNELTNVPLFSWTPVREAAYYIIEASWDSGFGSIRWSANTPNTFYWRNQWDVNDWGKQTFLRVRPIDGSGNPGLNSIQTTFVPTYTLALPEPISPRYYYSPPSKPTGNYAPPYNIPVSYDYTLDTPTFYWSRTFVPGVDPRVEADHYKLEVSDDPSFGTVDWTYETQNLSATPTGDASFVPISNTNYYWRVTPYDQLGAPLASSAANEKWVTQIDLSRRGAPVVTTSPPLLRPAFGEKVMDTLPSFEWRPQQGAVRYRFEIGTNSAVTPTVYMTRTVYTHHTPNVRLPKGTYFWRVCGLNGTNAVVGACTSGQRLIVANQTRWSYTRNYPLTLLTSISGTLIVTDTNDSLGAAELTTLYSAQDKDYWYIGFNVNPVLSGTVWYGLYLDGDQTDLSGATGAPAGRPQITTSAYYRPEFAIYVGYSNTQFITDTVPLYNWNKIFGSWDPVRNLVNPVQVAGGAFTYSSTLNYVELKIPKTAIGDLGSSPFILSMALFSANSTSALTAVDTVPSNGHSVSTLAEFKSIADRVTLALPADSPVGSPTQVPYTPYLYAETPNTDNLKGYKVEVAQDPGFTQILDTLDSTCGGCAPYVDIFQFVYSPLKFYLDKTLYWRYTIKHTELYPDGGSIAFSPPSEPHSFNKVGPTPTNLQIGGIYGLPTFRWNPVEGAAQYQLQVATNPQFSPTALDRSINHENFTPENILAPGRYYWHVRTINSYGANYNSTWSLSSTINITYPVVRPSTPLPGAIVHSAPTFSWPAVLTPTGQPTWGTPYYRLQVALAPNGFSAPFDEVTLDTTTWTPSRSYSDRTYYWRIAVQDRNGNLGPYSSVYTFTKQYLAVTILSPLAGAVTSGFPTFKWTPINGAARYQIQIANDPQYSQYVDNVVTDNTTFIPIKMYDTAQYYWRVAIMDRDGNLGPWTNSILLVNPYQYRVFVPQVLKR